MPFKGFHFFNDTELETIRESLKSCNRHIHLINQSFKPMKKNQTVSICKNTDKFNQIQTNFPGEH